MNKYCYINSKLTTSKNISYHDRGFRFGDGIFETIRVLNYTPYLLQYHIERLRTGLKILKIIIDIELIKSNLLKLIEINNHMDGIARIIVSRGIGSFGYLPLNNIKPTIILETAPLVICDKQKVDVCISSFEKTSPRSIPTGVKLLQGLNSILAKIEATEQGVFESLLLNHKGEICEMSSGNIFWVKDKKIYTPSVDCGLVNGVIRQRIIELFPVIIGKFQLYELLSADEVFMTNVSWIVLTVNKIDNVEFYDSFMSTIIHDKIIDDCELYCS